MSGVLLALDSSTATGSAAVGDASGVFAEAILRVSGGHSSALLPAIDQVLKSAGLRPRDLTGVVVGGGPGSFTGVRVAAATAKGIVRGLGIPLYAYSGLLVAAAAGWGEEGAVCALFDARRRDVYAACYRFGYLQASRSTSVETLVQPCAVSIDELLASLAEDPPALFTGEGALLYASEIEERLGSKVAPAHFCVPRASALLWLAANQPERGRVDDSISWEPLYVRAAGVERIAAAAKSVGAK